MHEFSELFVKLIEGFFYAFLKGVLRVLALRKHLILVLQQDLVEEVEPSSFGLLVNVR